MDFRKTIELRQFQHGERFTDASLDYRFVRYYENEKRIKVRSVYEGEKDRFGTVSISLGWGPVFLLMERSNQIGSSVVLNSSYIIVAEKRGREYVEVPLW